MIMNQNKKEAVDFCMRMFVRQKSVDIWLTCLLTLGLAILIFPIFLWLLYRYFKAKREMEEIQQQLLQNPEMYNQIEAFIGLNQTRYGQQIANCILLDIAGKRLEIPQAYIHLSKYGKKEILVDVLNS